MSAPLSTVQWLALVGAGGAAGAMARGGIALLLHGTRFPWATLVVNAAGSFLAGALMARLALSAAGGAADAPRQWQALLVTGFCGGFTTFSTFCWQTLEQLQRGQTLAAAANVAGSLALCLAAVWLGWLFGRP